MMLSTNALNFGTVTVNTTSAPLTLVIVNSGNAALTITNVSVGGVNPGISRSRRTTVWVASYSPIKLSDYGSLPDDDNFASLRAADDIRQCD